MFNFGLFDWIKIGAGFALGALVAGAVSYNVGIAVGHSRGVAAERAAALENAMDLIKKRGRDNAEIRAMDDAALCRELGGKWVLDHCE